MNFKNIDIFLINKDYKNIYKKRLSNILRKNQKRLSRKAILFTDNDFYKSTDFESIKRIIDDEYKFVEIHSEKINSKEYSKSCKIGSTYINKYGNSGFLFFNNLIKAYYNEFVIYQFIEPYLQIEKINNNPKNAIKNIFTLDCTNSTSLFDRTHLFKLHKRLSNQYLLKRFFSKNILNINRRINSYIK